MNLLFYNVVHVASIMLLFTALGAVIAGGAPRFNKTASMMHGISLVLLLVSGFGQLAKIGQMGSHKYWIAKLVILLLLGASLALAKRKIFHTPAILTIVLLLGAAATYLGVYKPF